MLAFFTISGFLITLSWERAQSWRGFLRRRVSRIYPGYLVAITLCSIVVVPAFSTRKFGDVSAGELGGLASNLLLRNFIISSDAFDGGAVNGSLWSIPFEFWCYLGIIAMGVTIKRSKIWFPAITLSVMLIRVWTDLTGRHPGGGIIETVIGYPYFWLNVLPPFMMGGIIYLFRDRLPRNWLLLLALVSTTVVVANAPAPDIVRTIAARFMLPPTLAYAIFFAAFSPSIRLHDAAKYGDFSYGAYLYAFPIQQMLVVALKGRTDFVTFIVLSMTTSLVAGIVSWHVVEKRFLTRKVAYGGNVRNQRPLDREAAIVAP